MKSVSRLVLTFCALTLALASADPKQAAKAVLAGKKADAEIKSFMTERWGRQVWEIEFRKVGDGIEDSLWHVKGSGWWVRFEPASYLTRDDSGFQFKHLKDLDQKSTYTFEGIPVDQGYGTITFYVTSVPKKTSLVKERGEVIRGEGDQAASGRK